MGEAAVDCVGAPGLCKYSSIVSVEGEKSVWGCWEIRDVK